MEQLGSHWTDFSKICRGNSSFIEIGQESRVLYMKTNIQFLSYLAQFFLEWEMFRTKVVEKNQNKHFVFSNLFFFSFLIENRAVYEKIWKNIVEWGMPQMTIWRMRIACWIPKANKYTHSGCVIHTASPQQKWLHECASMLRYTHIACLVQSYRQTKCLHHLCNDSSAASISQFTLYPLRQLCLPSMTSSSMTSIPVVINKRHLV
jgi:hypothetical protein